MKQSKPDYSVILLFSGIILIFSSLWTTAQELTQTEQNQQSELKITGQKFLLTGFGVTGYKIGKIGNETESTFGETGFNPIFLWKPSEKLFFESELEFELEGNDLRMDLEYANISYFLNKFITIRMGKFLSPFGTFQERIHPAWINKLVEKPLGFGHSAVGPGSEVGVEIRGGIPLGTTKMNYSLYLSNGPSLNTGGTNSMMAGKLEYENFEDNNLNKAAGGRIGLLPFSNSSLEIGLSGQAATVGSIGDSIYEDTKSTLIAVDISLIKSLKFMKSNLDMKAQFNRVVVDQKAYSDPINTNGMMFYTFDNTSQAFYFQMAIRPVMLKNKLLSNAELAGRFSALELPEEAKWGEEMAQITAGVNFWLTWRSVIKFNYQLTNGHDKESEVKYLIQLATGF